MTARRAKNVEQTELMESERVPREVALAPINPGKLIEQAIKTGLSAEGIERLVRLAREMQDREDVREMSRTLAKAQREFPTIPKLTPTQFTSAPGASDHLFADLQTIAKHVDPVLHSNGFSYSWNQKASDNGAFLTISCILRHDNGQSIVSDFTVPTASKGGMSDQQKFSAAQAVGRRKSLEQALGLVANDVPSVVTREFDPTPVSDEQAANLGALIEETKADVPRFLKFFMVAAVAELPARRYGEAVNMLEQKRRGW